MMKNNKSEPEYVMSLINTKVINYNVYKLSSVEKIKYTVILLLAGGFIGIVFYGGLFKVDGEATINTKICNFVVFLVGGILANVLILPSITDRLKNKRLSTLKIQFRDFLSVLSTTLSSGMNMRDSIINAYDDLASQYGSDSLIAIEVAEMKDCLDNNIPIERAIESLGERSGMQDISNFSTIFAVSFETGGNIKDIVSRTSDIIVDKMLINEEIQTKLSSNKIELYVMLVVPVALITMMRFMSSSFAEGFASRNGVIAISAALLMFFGAYKMGSKILDIKG